MTYARAKVKGQTDVKRAIEIHYISYTVPYTTIIAMGSQDLYIGWRSHKGHTNVNVPNVNVSGKSEVILASRSIRFMACETC